MSTSLQLPDPRLWILRRTDLSRLHPIVRELVAPKAPPSALQRTRTIDFEAVAKRLYAELEACRDADVRLRLIQCLHMALMHTDKWDSARIVNPHLFEPQCLTDIFLLSAYTTLQKRIPTLGCLSILYRKAFPAKRQPRHWKNVTQTLWKKHRLAQIHMTEVAAWFYAGLLKHKPTLVSLEDHRQWAEAYWKRFSPDFVDISSFYTESTKESLLAVSCFFERMVRPFAAEWTYLSPVWEKYTEQLGAITDLEQFNSSMAKTGPECVVPLSFWETVFQTLGAEPCDSMRARDAHIMNSVAQETDEEAALEFLRLVGDPSSRQVLSEVIRAFHHRRTGPSVLKTILVKKMAPYLPQIKRMAWQWFSAFGSYFIQWPRNMDQRAENAINERFEALKIRDLAHTGRRLQLCLNCGLIHTAHNQPAPLKDKSSVTVYDALKTVGVTRAVYDVLFDKSYCGRQNSTISIGCKRSEASCFLINGWTYHNYSCFFICTECGIPATWDLTTCKFVTDGPLCSLCSLRFKEIARRRLSVSEAWAEALGAVEALFKERSSVANLAYELCVALMEKIPDKGPSAIVADSALRLEWVPSVVCIVSHSIWIKTRVTLHLAAADLQQAIIRIEALVKAPAH